ncbi:MAG: type II toxin-antitoxin system RelE/ParE family toxin [Gemmatimonadota bacterium]
MREVRFYRTASGRSPIEEFLDSLPGKQAQKVVWVLRLVEELDHVPAEYLSKLAGTDDLWEVRSQHTGNEYRLLGFFDDPGVLVLTNGFAKKTRKTPKQAIRLAAERRKDYLDRGMGDE